MNDPETLASDDTPAVLVIAEHGGISTLIGSYLAATDTYKIFGPYLHSVDAVTRLRKTHIDVVVIDLGMTQSNPSVSISRILKVDALAKIVMIAEPSPENESRSQAGFDKGAAFYLPAPASTSDGCIQSGFGARFLDVIRKLVVARRSGGVRQFERNKIRKTRPNTKPTLRPFSNRAPGVIAIASSTGGPKALETLLAKLDPERTIPILITQHLPQPFTGVMATNLSRRINCPVTEAIDGEAVIAGNVYLAPGNYHMTVESPDGNPVIKLNQQPPVNFCRPSADTMLKSMAQVYGSDVCLIVLTGMGTDGKMGAKDIVNAGGQVIAQDFESSIVWGMPGAVSNAGYASKILPLEEIAPTVNELLALNK